MTAPQIISTGTAQLRAGLHHLLATNIPGCLDGSWEGAMLRPDRLSRLVDSVVALIRPLDAAQASVDRDAIARIIDEHSIDAVKMHGRQNASHQAVRMADYALDKADQILALTPAAHPTQGCDKGEAVWAASTHDEIIKRLMAGVGMPNSNSLYGAFKQFANELHALAHAAPQPASNAGGTESALKMVAGLFAESVHETYTREEVVSVVEDMMRFGRRDAAAAPKIYRSAFDTPTDQEPFGDLVDPAYPLPDLARLNWLQGRIVDTIYLDDGKIIDVRGNNVREAIDAAMDRWPGSLEDEDGDNKPEETSSVSSTQCGGGT